MKKLVNLPAMLIVLNIFSLVGFYAKIIVCVISEKTFRLPPKKGLEIPWVQGGYSKIKKINDMYEAY